MMATWMIEGTWSGYTSSQSRVAHREFTTREAFAKEVEKLGVIRYTDGTCLDLSVSRREGHGKRPPVINGYNTLIRDCISAGVHSVDALLDHKNAPK